MNQEWEQDSDEDSVIFNTSEMRRYVKKGQCRSVLKSSHYPGPPRPAGTNVINVGIPQEQFGHISLVREETRNSHHSPNASPAERIPPMCIQLPKQPLNPIQHGREERCQGQDQKRVQENRNFRGYEKHRKSNSNWQESRHKRKHAALVFRGFNNRYSNEKLQKDLLKHTPIGLSVFLMVNETLILKNAWQREIIPRQKMVDKLKASMTVINSGNSSRQNNPNLRAPSSQEAVMDGTISHLNTTTKILEFRTLNSHKSVGNNDISDSSIDDSLSGIEELGEILEETFIDMNNSIRREPENSCRAITEEPMNMICNEYETEPALCPDVSFSSTLQKPDKSQLSKSHSKGAFSVQEPDGEILAVEIPYVDVKNTEDINMHFRCRNYLFDKKCPRGDYCSFLHTLPKTDNIICKDFQLGKCLRTAAQCWFKHPGEEITENIDSYEEGLSREDSVGTLLSLLKTQQKGAAAPKPSHSQVSALEFIGKLKISKPKPVGTPRKKTSEQDAGPSTATGKEVIENDNQRQVPPVTIEVQHKDKTVVKATCSKESLSIDETSLENSLAEIDAVLNSSDNIHPRTETSVSKNGIKFDQDKRKCKENITMVELKKVGKEDEAQEKRKTAPIGNKRFKGSNSVVSVNVVDLHHNGITVKNKHVDRPKTYSIAGTLTGKKESFKNKTLNSREESSSIKNSHGISTTLRRESKDKQRKDKNNESKKISHIDNIGGNDKCGIHVKNDTCKFSSREKEKESDMSTSKAMEYENKKSSKYPLIKSSSKDLGDESIKSSKDADKGKKSLEVTKDQNKKHRGSKSKHLGIEDINKSSDPYEKAKKAKRRRPDASAMPTGENREDLTKVIGPSEDESEREIRDVQNSKSCYPDNLNMIRSTKSAPDTLTLTKTEPDTFPDFADHSVHESVIDKSSVQFFTLDTEKSKNVVKTETCTLIETSEMSEEHGKKVYILTELTKQWLHDVDENYKTSGDPFDDLCQVIQEMGLEIWNDVNYPYVYIWEANMRRMFVSLYTSLDLETFTKEIHKVMKDIPDIYMFFAKHKCV